MARTSFPITRLAVHNAVRGFLPHALPLIRNVIRMDAIGTMAVDKRGNLYYCQDFVDKVLVEKGRLDEKCMAGVMAHEMFHLIFNHFLKNEDPHLNLGADIIINSTLMHMYPGPTGRCKLMRKFYKDAQFPYNLLKPGARRQHDGPAQRLYDRCWKLGEMTTPDVVATLRAIIPDPPKDSGMLLGNHGKLPEDKGPEDEIWAEAIEKTIGDLHSKSELSGKQAGLMGQLLQDMLKIPITQRQLRQKELTKVAARKRVIGFISKGIKHRPTTSVLPTHMSRTDIILLGAGAELTRFHTTRKEKGKEDQESHTIYLFLDVSGSMSSDLPEIISCLRPLKGSIERCWMFSDETIECQFDELLEGKIKTTGGTKFDIVGQTMMDNNVKKALIITDGGASFSEGMISQMKSFGIQTLTFVYNQKEIVGNPWWEFGEVMTLDIGDLANAA